MRHVDRFALPFILLPVLLIANNGSDGSARAATCVARPTQWNIGGDSGQVNLMRSLPSRRLPVNSAPLKGQFRAGVTAARFSHRIQLTVESLPKQPGCFRLAEVNINFSIISPIRVHIASELKEGTCPYNVTLTHEFRHVEIARQNLKMMVESAETELPSLVGNSAIRASSLHNARRIFLDTLVRVTGDAGQRFSDRARRAHELIDTPAAYRQEREKCPAKDWQKPFQAHLGK